jgi:hypothetical protein
MEEADSAAVTLKTSAAIAITAVEDADTGLVSLSVETRVQLVVAAQEEADTGVALLSVSNTLAVAASEDADTAAVSVQSNGGWTLVSRPPDPGWVIKTPTPVVWKPVPTPQVTWTPKPRF